jgi:hypothetical protein
MSTSPSRLSGPEPRVRYPSTTMSWVFSVSPSGKINGFGLRESWSKRLASIILRDITGY